MQIKKIILLVFILFLAFKRPIFAHQLAKDGSITVVMHTNPDDKPIAKNQTEIFFDIQKNGQNIDFSKCNCNVKIFQNGKALFETPLSDGNLKYKSLFNSQVDFSFPDKGNYFVQLSGQSKNNADFKSFNVKYQLSVGEEDNVKKTELLFLSLFTIVGAILIVYFVVKYYKLLLKKPKT